jgi:sulfatase maturation enzyme AslB (radical SAM superfamily)
MPHINLAMQNNGDVCVCNKNTESFKDGKHNLLHIHKDGLAKIWNSHTRKMIAAGLDHGKRLPGCQACWNDEDAGVESNRQRFNKVFADVKPSKAQPKVLIIKPGNVCNLGCRMCNPATSTSMYQDFYKLDTDRKSFSGTLKDYTNQFELIREGFSKDNNLVWPVLKEWTNELIFIDIYGGEPMLAPTIWEVLEHSVQNGSSKNTSIEFHTNCTIWNEKYINLLPAFKSVDIGISIDHHEHKQLSYIRHGVDAETLLTNLEKYKQLELENSSINLHITLTVTPYNVWDLDLIVDELEAHMPVAINVVYLPELLDIRHLPIPIKQKLISKFESNHKLTKIVQLLNHTIPGCDVYWPKFCEEFRILDKIRNQSFAECFPEYYKELEPYIV